MRMGQGVNELVKSVVAFFALIMFSSGLVVSGMVAGTDHTIPVALISTDPFLDKKRGNWARLLNRLASGRGCQRFRIMIPLDATERCLVA
jgi:hypothetical protein